MTGTETTGPGVTGAGATGAGATGASVIGASVIGASVIGAAIRLYPRRYREEYGAEIRAVYEETAAEASAVNRLRETADIAAHAVRMRLGLNSSTAAGRILAAAAPYAAGAAAVTYGTHLTSWYAALATTPTRLPLSAALPPDAWTALLLASAVVCAGAVTALTGRWHAGARTVAAGLVAVAVAALISGPAFADPVVTPAMALLTALVVLACPPGLHPTPRARKAAGTMTIAAWLPLAALHTGALPITTDYGLWPLLVLAATILPLSLRARSAGRRETLTMTAACPPLLAYAYTTAWGTPLPVLTLATVLPLAGALAAAAHAIRGRARARTRVRLPHS
ncbi:hypothetical protein AB0O07_13415 [Streptomyces sp. NPDC093085]|uniref:hypothetical protein n=1 Tax=Streptomyces sp. NPDC093085 TaxID=3155068 RepID=UPI003415C098